MPLLSRAQVFLIYLRPRCATRLASLYLVSWSEGLRLRDLSHQTSRSPYLLYPYFIILGTGFAGSMYCMVRMTLVSWASHVDAIMLTHMSGDRARRPGLVIKCPRSPWELIVCSDYLYISC